MCNFRLFFSPPPPPKKNALIMTSNHDCDKCPKLFPTLAGSTVRHNFFVVVAAAAAAPALIMMLLLLQQQPPSSSSSRLYVTSSSSSSSSLILGRGVGVGGERGRGYERNGLTGDPYKEAGLKVVEANGATKYLEVLTSSSSSSSSSW